ncbi:DNA-directed DNA polymerase [Kocuria rosea]|uniref:DNA-directed DNA polymerase n=1 Tax=Kocuria rosea TaxID=1275 RepID=UPI002013BD54|nr:DNA-directed DNA polymerase [Kocuria rosea]
MSAGLACTKDLFFTHGTTETPGRTAMAAPPYGEQPHDAAAADARAPVDAAGWSRTVVADSATSRKHPAEFEVLTHSIARGARGAAGFGQYSSVAAMSTDQDSIVIGFDTEFVTVDLMDADRVWVGEDEHMVRKIVSYQFAAIDPLDDSQLRLCVVIPRSYRGPRGSRTARLSFEKGLEIAIMSLGLHEHRLAAGWTDKGVSAQSAIGDDGKSHPSVWFKHSPEGTPRALPITLVAHYQHADLTTFVDRRKAINVWNQAYPSRSKTLSDRAGWDGRRARWLDGRAPDILRTVISASAGMVSNKPARMVLSGENWRWKLPVEVSIRDTMAQSGAEPLKALGAAIGAPKLDVPGDWITRMDEYFDVHPAEFLDYAANDAVIALEYVSQLYGDHRAVPLTLPTAAAKAVKGLIQDELGEGRDFNTVFGGLHKVTKTREGAAGVDEQQLDFYRVRALEPIDGAAATWIHAAAMSFRGGYNMSAELGLFARVTSDFDLQSCYPTSSSTIWDVDYQHPDGVILKTVNNADLTLSDFKSPLTPFLGFVSFEFPSTVAFPSLPVPVEGSMVYPLTSGGVRGVWATGPEVWLALTLGATVTCQIGHFGRVLTDEHGEPSRLLRGAYKQLLDDRARAKAEFGAKSFEQNVLKLMANSPYGKLAQGVMGQRGWDAWAQERDAVGGSAITSPWHASMTTGLVRAVLLATLNQLHNLGYSTPSCTTDGFITDADLDVVDSLDLFGLGPIWRESRLALTGSQGMWERKHQQTDLLNITTRANFSRQPAGVLAHGGYKLPDGIEQDSQADRDLMYELMASREGALPVTMKVFPSVQELTRIDKRLDFAPRVVHKEQTIEFDRKRRPVPDGMSVDVIDIDGVHHEVAHVHTVPWDSPEQATLGRSVDQGLKEWDDDLGEPVWIRSPVRRTVEQWKDYFARLDALLDEDGSIAQAEQLEHIAKGIVIAFRQEIIDIPWLHPGQPLADRLDAFEAFGLPRVKERFWSHARSKAERQIDIDLKAIRPYVKWMQAIDPFDESASAGAS